MDRIKHIHFTSIKGVGMTPLAVIAKEAGFVVTGSDVSEVYITDEVLKDAGFNKEIPNFDERNIKNVDLLITSGANGGFDNIEVVAAKEKGIPIMTQGEAVGFFMSGKLFGRGEMKGISVTGCHGKTTTTAMIATLLKSAGKDPSYVIGTGNVPSLGSSGHYGKGEYFVAEADEYATEPKYDKTTKFLWQHPKIAVVTNIEYDHPDLYSTFQSLIGVYKKFIEEVVSEGGLVISCGDDPEIRKIIDKNKTNIITYGFNSDNDYVLKILNENKKGIKFYVQYKKSKIGPFIISSLGRHNALNALASIIVGINVDLTQTQIKGGLENFKGTKRRMEFIGYSKNGAKIFDDYAHHPTEIKKTLQSLRERYKNSKIVCVFQPHTFSRTKMLFKDFTNSFSGVNLLILTDIYASQREPFDKTISSKDLALSISKKGDVIYLPKLNDVVEYLKKKKFAKDTIILAMGAGDVYKIAYELVE